MPPRKSRFGPRIDTNKVPDAAVPKADLSALAAKLMGQAQPVANNYAEPSAYDIQQDALHSSMPPNLRPGGVNSEGSNTATLPSGSKPGDWPCPGCQANNFARNFQCFKCRTPRPGGQMPQAGGGSTLFVAKLGYNVSSDDLRQIFAIYGRVTDCNVVMDKETGQSRGFAFVEFGSRTEAEGALALNGSEIQGRNIIVKFKDDKPRNAGPGGRPGDWTCPQCNANVYANKTRCFKCQTPKPGSGGGYGGNRGSGGGYGGNRGSGGGYGGNRGSGGYGGNRGSGGHGGNRGSGGGYNNDRNSGGGYGRNSGGDRRSGGGYGRNNGGDRRSGGGYGRDRDRDYNSGPPGLSRGY